MITACLNRSNKHPGTHVLVSSAPWRRRAEKRVEIRHEIATETVSGRRDGGDNLIQLDR